MKTMPLLTSERQREIDQIVLNLCTRIGMSYPDNGMMDICKELKIDVREGDFGVQGEKVSGMVTAKGEGINAPQIYLNWKNTPERKLFTLAHEIGHLELGHVVGEKFRIDEFDYSKDSDNQETEANYFAAALLVPRYKLKEAYSAYFGNIKLIANFFHVSPSMIETRLNWIKANPL